MRRIGLLQDASLPEALQENFLHGVIELLLIARVVPARGKISPDDRGVAADEVLAVGPAPCGGRLDYRPASRIGSVHA
jgi:hypothetical protein